MTRGEKVEGASSSAPKRLSVGTLEPETESARPGVLREWLSPLSLDEFRTQFLHTQAWAKPSAARQQVALCGWKAVGNLLEKAEQSHVLVVAGGQMLERSVPRDLTDLRALMTQGAGLCIRHVERHDGKLRSLGRSLGGNLGGKEVHVQIFVTPGATHGFGWHYDAEDVFIVQTAGIKDYYFRRNTIDAHEPVALAPDFSRIRAEVSPLQTARLVAGDCLYIPARWWHMARAVEDSLSISLGAPESPPEKPIPPPSPPSPRDPGPQPAR
jgi:50S ribosomal protein L16 3-hydroxylase